MTKKSKNGLFGDPQNWIAIGVTMISVCALVVSIMQTRIMKEQRELMHSQASASVWPNLGLVVWKGHNVEDNTIIEYELRLSNSGIGPAIINGVRISYNDKAVRQWGNLFQNFELNGMQTYRSNNGISDRVLKPGEELIVLSLTENLPLAQLYFDNSESIKYEILYKSIYNEFWLLTKIGGYNAVIEKVTENFKFEEGELFLN